MKRDRPQLLLAMTLLLALVSGEIVYAQSPIATGWSAPDKISDLPSTVGGALVTGDSDGSIYVVWFANSEEKSGDLVDTVYFRHWNRTEWSPSVDILTAPPGGPWLRVDQLVLDAYGRLILLWRPDRQLVLSIAEPTEAGRATGWRSIPLLSNELTYQSDIAAGPDGVLHVLGIGEAQNVYYLRSEDMGENWNTVQISAGSDATQQYSWGSLALDPGNPNSLYASWTESREDQGWTVTGVYASHSVDGGATWSEPASLVSARGHGHSTIVALDGPGDDVMVFWNRAVGSVDGRYYALSDDGGETWGEPQIAYERVSGLNGPPYLFTDSLGQLHMIGAGYNALTPVGGEQIWYSRWDSSRWAEPQLINVAGKPMTGNEVFDARLVGGNRLLYTWTDAATKEIWVTSQTLPGPSVPDVRLDLPAPTPPTAVARPDDTPAPAPPTPASSPSLSLAETGRQPDSVLPPLIAGVLPAVLLVAVVIIFGVRGRSRP